MKKLLFVLFILFGSVLYSNVDAQVIGKKRDKIEVASEVKSCVINGLVTQIYDFKGQFDELESMKMEAKALGRPFPEVEFVIIYDDSKKLYRLAETQQEINRQSDNLNVFRKKESEIFSARRTKYD